MTIAGIRRADLGSFNERGQWAGHDTDIATKGTELDRHLVALRRTYPEASEPCGLADELEQALRGQ